MSSAAGASKSVKCMSSDAAALAARLAREEGRRLTAALLRVVGAARLDFAEDCVQEALASALTAWPVRGVPADPFAWVLAAARNRALDRFRRNATAAAFEPKIADWVRALAAPAAGATGDEELAMLVMCCHEALDEEARIALTLKSVCGFSVPEIARAFLVKPETLAQRLVRAKARIRELNLDFGVPGAAALRMRMRSVLKAIYLTFNEGYAPGGGDLGLKADVCAEALRLIRVVTADSRTASPEAWALRALIAFQHSRAAARIGADGALILLPDQDRALWDRALIAEGFRALQRAMGGDALSAYHLEAGAASVHAGATSWAATNWAEMMGFYDALMETAPTPVAAVNRALAVSMRDGAEAGLAALDPYTDQTALRAYAPFWIVQADLLARAGRRGEARAALEAALAQDLSEPERRLIVARLGDHQEVGTGQRRD
jgi:RNA polymerase sigma-70 factor, ECF subfamily